MKKVLKVIRIIFGILLLIVIGGYFFLMTHTQIIVRFIQKTSSETVNTKNSYEPLREPYTGVKKNGQYVIAEINYSKEYPNSFLDITYTNENTEEDRPTLFYFHGGGNVQNVIMNGVLKYLIDMLNLMVVQNVLERKDGKREIIKNKCNIIYTLLFGAFLVHLLQVNKML